MNEENKVAFESWCKSPVDTDQVSAFAWLAWQAACNYQRESDAKICDDKHYTWRFGDGDDAISGPKECAEAIRANKGE